jgi:hypothetical protein
MQLVQDLHMRCYRLHLRLVALCQAISLGVPIQCKSILVRARKLGLTIRIMLFFMCAYIRTVST